MSVIIKARGNWLQYSTSLLFAICIITLPAYTSVGKMAFYLLALLSLFYLAKNFHELKTLDPLIKIFFIVIVVGFLWTLFTFYINGSPGRGKSFIWSRQAFLLFLPSLFLLFRCVKPSFYVIWGSVVLSVVLATYVGYQDTLTGWGRAQGGMHPILFGSILLCEAMFLLLVMVEKKQLMIRLISLVAVMSALTAVVWTQSRGVWVAFPVLMLMLAMILIRQYSMCKKIIIVSLVVAIIAALSLHPTVQKRLDVTEKNIKNYIHSDGVNDPSKKTSIGARLQMLKAGWQIFIENPVVGVGLGGYDLAAKAGKDRYGVTSSAYWFYHPHNQYVSAMSTRGVPGLLLILVILLMPVYYYKKRKSNSLVEQRAVFYYAPVMTYVICCAYGVFGLTDVPLEGKATILFFVLMIALLLSMNTVNRKAFESVST